MTFKIFASASEQFGARQNCDECQHITKFNSIFGPAKPDGARNASSIDVFVVAIIYLLDSRLFIIRSLDHISLELLRLLFDIWLQTDILVNAYRDAINVIHISGYDVFFFLLWAISA